MVNKSFRVATRLVSSALAKQASQALITHGLHPSVTGILRLNGQSTAPTEPPRDARERTVRGERHLPVEMPSTSLAGNDRDCQDGNCALAGAVARAPSASRHRRLNGELAGAGRIGALECKLLALALADASVASGAHHAVRAIWLQNNAIDAIGLRWLARGLNAMPDGTALRSISLGENSFHRQRRAAGAGQQAVDAALTKLEAAAAAKRVRLRLLS